MLYSLMSAYLIAVTAVCVLQLHQSVCIWQIWQQFTDPKSKLCKSVLWRYKTSCLCSVAFQEQLSQDMCFTALWMHIWQLWQLFKHMTTIYDMSLTSKSYKLAWWRYKMPVLYLVTFQRQTFVLQLHQSVFDVVTAVKYWQQSKGKTM